MIDSSKFSNKVVKAFEETNTRPICGRFIKKGNKQKMACCGLSVLALKAGAITKTTPEENGYNLVTNWAYRQFGDDFSCGFMEGFDGEKRSSGGSEHRNGYNCGRLSAKKLGLLND